MENLKESITYDAAGNVTNRLITGLQGFSDTIETPYRQHAVNRLTNGSQFTNGALSAEAGYEFDGAGRLSNKIYGNGDVVQHVYDLEGRLLTLAMTNGGDGVFRFDYLRNAVGSIGISQDIARGAGIAGST